jgi:tRNA(Ile)-lysidine synthase
MSKSFLVLFSKKEPLPVTSAEFRDLLDGLAPFSSARRIAVAVSGGADSLCLALLAASWGRSLALIVDHGLRPESAAEASLTAARLKQLDIPYRILTLHNVGASAAAARQARYTALAMACSEAGLSDLLLGHHAADQAETVLMRARAASGPAGLAGMAAITHGATLRLLRPLLGVPSARLRATLNEAGLEWVEDPSNRNAAYLRARLRQEIGASGQQHALTRDADRYAAARAVAERETASFLARHVAIFPEGYGLIGPGPMPAGALSALIRTMGGAGFAPGSASVARMAADPAPGVLGGVRLLPAGSLGRGLMAGGWLAVREPRAMAASVPARHGAIWDGRFTLASPDLPEGLDFGPVGDDAKSLRKYSRLPFAVLQTLPCLRRQGALAAVPHIGYLGCEDLDGLGAWFTPSHPLAGAPFEAPRGGCEVDAAPPC